jgi:hypothetical protein
MKGIDAKNINRVILNFIISSFCAAKIGFQFDNPEE